MLTEKLDADLSSVATQHVVETRRLQMLSIVVEELETRKDIAARTLRGSSFQVNQQADCNGHSR